MKIHRVRLAGFRGVQQPLEVPCGRGFTVICGNNGAGKSTICDAIEFVLSGSLGFHVGSERGEYISNYIWWRGPAAREHYAAVDISDPEGDVFTVQRTRRHSSGEQWLPRLIDSHSAPNDWRSELCLTSILRDESITTLSTDIPERERYDFALRAIGLANSVVVETGIASVIADLESRRSEAIKIYEAERDKVESFTAELSQACISATKASKKSLERIRLAYAQSLKDQLDLSGLGELIAQKLAQLRSRLNSLERWRDGKEALEKHRTETATVEFQRMVKRRESEWQSLQASFAKVQQSYEAISAQLRNEQTRSPLVTSLANLKEHGQRVGMRNGKCPLCGSQISQGDFDNHLSELEREIKQVSDGVAAAVHAERETARRWTN